jgi:hypothetical protein
MPKSDWSVEQKRQLVEALLKCPILNTRQGRDDVIGQLPKTICHGIQRRDDARADVTNILERCLNYSDGLAALQNALNHYEQDSIPFQNLAKLLGTPTAFVEQPPFPDLQGQTQEIPQQSGAKASPTPLPAQVSRLSQISPTIWVAIIGAIGTIIVALFGVWQVILPIIIPIQATQTAESRPTQIIQKSEPPTIASPTPWAGPCQVEKFEVLPSSPQPVGMLVVISIQADCKAGVRAIRLMINDQWYNEKGGHIAPPNEFNLNWKTDGLAPGDYTLTAEVATWGDDDWKFSAGQTITYTLISSVNTTP